MNTLYEVTTRRMWFKKSNPNLHTRAFCWKIIDKPTNNKRINNLNLPKGTIFFKTLTYCGYSINAYYYYITPDDRIERYGVPCYYRFRLPATAIEVVAKKLKYESNGDNLFWSRVQYLFGQKYGYPAHGLSGVQLGRYSDTILRDNMLLNDIPA